VEIEAEHVRAAQVSRRQRVSYYRESAQESLLRGRRFVETEGSVIGQVNVLGVYSAPEAAFCIPSRTTATVRLGGGRVIDVERESNLAGNIRSKGMVILSSVLIDRYAAERHLRLTVSLATEQSYRKRDGDSASLASLCASISAISGVPIKQCFAMTGSISQHGQVHPIGATNTKIEGFFDICVARGLTGEQGVIIPAANLDDLMLREDVVEACAEGKFSVYAVSTVDEALALLTGEQPGEKDKHGKYPEDSVNGKVIAAIDRWERIFHDKPPTQRPQAEQAASKAGDEKQAKSGKRKKKKKHKRRQKKAD
jgi:predicted ATP-dependent protease